MRRSPSPSPFPLDPWRLAELLALVATIPAFYMAMLETHRAAMMALYALACAASLASLRLGRHAERRAPSQAGARAARMHLRLAAALPVALALSALLPRGHAMPWLGVRLATAALIVWRMLDALRPWYSRGGLPNLLGLAVVVLGLCGLGFWWLEPNVHSYADGLWLAFTTAATVGYGDMVPSTPAARIFAVFVVLLGVAVLSLVTASIAASWVESEERRIEREIVHDIHRQLRSLREDLAALRNAPGSAAGGGTSESGAPPSPAKGDGSAPGEDGKDAAGVYQSTP